MGYTPRAKVCGRDDSPLSTLVHITHVFNVVVVLLLLLLLLLLLCVFWGVEEVQG